MRTIKKSFDPDGYECKYPWPKDCYCQCGDSGVVMTDKRAYKTAFFEAFPMDPDTFIRGEGETVEEAEKKTWKEYKKQADCEKHEFERKGYTNGSGFCKHCGLFSSKAFEPTTKCCICGKPTAYSRDNDDNFYCEEHDHQMPANKMPKWRRRMEDMDDDYDAFDAMFDILGGEDSE